MLNLLALLLAAYLVLVAPALGVRAQRRLRRRLAGDPAARRRWYLASMARKWPLTALALGVGAALGLLPPRALGHGATLQVVRGQPLPPQPGGLAPLVLPIAIGLVVGAALMLRLARRPDGRAVLRRLLGGAALLLPTTAAERRLLAAVAVTAGVTEEVLYRGFLPAEVGALLPRLGSGGALALAAAAFGLAHAYQGARNVLLTGIVGGVLALLYVQTGGLLVPMAVHAAIDLRLLLLPPAVVRELQSAPSRVGSMPGSAADR